MSRDQFAPFASLTEVDLARVLAAIGAFYPDRHVNQSIDKLVRTPGTGFSWRRTAARPPTLTFPVRLRALQDYIADNRQRRALAKPSWNAEFWLDRWYVMLSKSPPLLRVQLDIGDLRPEADLAIDLDWLLTLLAQRDLPCAGICLALLPEHVELTWNWPLQI